MRIPVKLAAAVALGVSAAFGSNATAAGGVFELLFGPGKLEYRLVKEGPCKTTYEGVRFVGSALSEEFEVRAQRAEVCGLPEDPPTVLRLLKASYGEGKGRSELFEEVRVVYDRKWVAASVENFRGLYEDFEVSARLGSYSLTYDETALHARGGGLFRIDGEGEVPVTVAFDALYDPSTNETVFHLTFDGEGLLYWKLRAELASVSPKLLEGLKSALAEGRLPEESKTEEELVRVVPKRIYVRFEPYGEVRTRLARLLSKGGEFLGNEGRVSAALAAVAAGKARGLELVLENPKGLDLASLFGLVLGATLTGEKPLSLLLRVLELKVETY
ncbi:MAG: hypothetical protein GXO08_05075 [Aquificae bacterium]|nr:hypothetical protein [Aquificota bacterium]